MTRLWRIVASLAAALTGLQALSGCPMYGALPAYGMPFATLEVDSFTVAPPGPAHVGDSLTFYAQLEAAGERSAEVNAGNLLEQFHLALHDDGVAPDMAAGDNVFSGSGVWQARFGMGSVSAALFAQGEKDGVWAVGNASLPLEVLP